MLPFTGVADEVQKYGPSFCITVSENVVTVLLAKNEKLGKEAKNLNPKI